MRRPRTQAKRAGKCGLRFCQIVAIVDLDDADLDLIAQKEDEDLLVIVEVKTRRNERFGDASLAVTPQKIRSIIIATNAFVKTYQVHSRIRFDIITIVGTHAETAQVRHVEDVPLM